MKPYRQAAAEDELAAAFRDGDEQRIALLGPAVDAFDVPRVHSIEAAALWYAEQGLRVLPLQPGLKEPHKGSRGCSEASSDPRVIAAWWQRWPGSNVGIATGHRVDVIDFDSEAGQGAWSARFPDPTGLDPYGGLSVVGSVSTPRAGGLHIYVAATKRRSNRIGMLPGVDFRGVGGYVVAPPSHTQVGSYRWLRTLRTDELNDRDDRRDKHDDGHSRGDRDGARL